MANKEHLLKLAYYMEQGSHGTDDDPNNPLSRAVNYLLEDVQCFTRIALCFLGDLKVVCPKVRLFHLSLPRQRRSQPS
jgi:hypothetical protein